MSTITTVPDLENPFAPAEPDAAAAPDVRDPPPHGPPG
jgi:hypothetical protein